MRVGPRKWTAVNSSIVPTRAQQACRQTLDTAGSGATGRAMGADRPSAKSALRLGGSALRGLSMVAPGRRHLAVRGLSAGCPRVSWSLTPTRPGHSPLPRPRLQDANAPNNDTSLMIISSRTFKTSFKKTGLYYNFLMFYRENENFWRELGNC